MIKLFEFTVDIDQIQKDTGALFHSKLLAEVGPVLACSLIVLVPVGVLDRWKLEDVFESLFCLIPVFLLDFDLRLHEHKDRVVTDAEVLGEGLLEEIVSGAHIACI